MMVEGRQPRIHTTVTAMYTSSDAGACSCIHSHALYQRRDRRTTSGKNVVSALFCTTPSNALNRACPPMVDLIPR